MYSNPFSKMEQHHNSGMQLHKPLILLLSHQLLTASLVIITPSSAYSYLLQDSSASSADESLLKMVTDDPLTEVPDVKPKEPNNFRALQRIHMAHKVPMLTFDLLPQSKPDAADDDHHQDKSYFHYNEANGNWVRVKCTHSDHGPKLEVFDTKAAKNPTLALPWPVDPVKLAESHNNDPLPVLDLQTRRPSGSNTNNNEVPAAACGTMRSNSTTSGTIILMRKPTAAAGRPRKAKKGKFKLKKLIGFEADGTLGGLKQNINAFILMANADLWRQFSLELRKMRKFGKKWRKLFERLRKQNVAPLI